MMVCFSGRALPPLLLVVCLLLSSCSGDPNVRKQKYFASGQRYFDNGKYPEAVIEFVNAIHIDPSYAEAHHQLAETYLRLQQGQRACEELTRTVELQPANYQARIELATVLGLGHQFQLAQEQTNVLLQERPNDPAVHSVVSGLLLGQGNISGAIEEMQTAVALDPSRWQLHLELATLRMKNNDSAAAEMSLKKVIELDPKEMKAQLLLGNYYQSRNRLGEAERQFRYAMELDPNSPDPRAALARLYFAEGKKADAEDVLQQAKHDFQNNSAGYRLLGDFYFLNGDVDKAVAEYTALYQDHPSDIAVKKNYILLLVRTKRFADARKLNDEILKANPNDEDALVYQSQMQITNGDANGAAQKLQALIKDAPNNSEAHYALGVAFENLGDLKSAEGEWREALRLRPDFLDAQRDLAGAAMRQSEMPTLQEAATQMISLQPASPEGYALRALSYINLKQYGEAEKDIRKAIGIAPQNSFGYVQMGNLRFAEHQFADAAKAYQTALDLNQNSTDALRGLMNTYIAQKQVERALAIAEAQISKVPNNGPFYDLLGSVLFYNRHDLPAAESALKKSAELDRKNPDSLIKLGQVEAAAGRTDQAIDTYRQALQAYPHEVTFYLVLGEMYQSKQDWPNAGDSYQKALVLAPENALASGKLAFVMVQSGQNLDVALSLAQTARRGLPTSPAIADTLGWIYYEKGVYPSAIDSLQEALRLGRESKSADNPKTHFHLGMAYAKNGQSALARQQLQLVLKINPNSADAADARKQLAQIKS